MALLINDSNICWCPPPPPPLFSFVCLLAFIFLVLLVLSTFKKISDGFTPLMLASFRGGGLDLGCDDESGSGSGSGDSGDGEATTSADIITSLLMQGAAINAQTDRTGV